MPLVKTYGGVVRSFGGTVCTGCGCGPPPVVFTCSGHTLRIPQFMTAVFPSVSNGTCTDCNGRGGTQLMETPGSEGVIFCDAGSCCFFRYNNVGPDVEYQLGFLVPTNGVSNVTVAARLLLSACGTEAVWRTTTLPWQSDFTSFSATLPFDGPSGLCSGTASTNVGVTA